MDLVEEDVAEGIPDAVPESLASEALVLEARLVAALHGEPGGQVQAWRREEASGADWR